MTGNLLANGMTKITGPDTIKPLHKKKAMIMKKTKMCRKGSSRRKSQKLTRHLSS